MKTRVYTFQCPLCKSKFTYDKAGEPMCTGPGTLNQHEPKVMHRIHVADYNIDKNVSPEEGAKRAAGPLIMDNLLDYIYSVDGKVEIDGRKKRLWLPGRNR